LIKNAAELIPSTAFLFLFYFINLMILPFNGWFVLPLEGDITGLPPAAGGSEFLSSHYMPHNP